MFFRIEFNRSKVPFSERAAYLQRLDTAARANKYCPGRAYIPNSSTEYEIIVCDKLGLNSVGCHSNEIKAVLRELKKRGCKVFSL